MRWNLQELGASTHRYWKQVLNIGDEYFNFDWWSPPKLALSTSLQWTAKVEETLNGWLRKNLSMLSNKILPSTTFSLFLSSFGSGSFPSSSRCWSFNAMDGNGNPPLHFLAKLKQEKVGNPYYIWNQDKQQLVDSITRLLLNSGAHLDRVNKEGLKAAEVWNQCNDKASIRERVAAEWIDLSSWLHETVRKLCCLSAKNDSLPQNPLLAA